MSDVPPSPPWAGLQITPATLKAELAAVEKQTGVLAAEMLSGARNRRISHARQYAMWRLRQQLHNGHAKYAMIEIARAFSRDHSTVCFAVEKVKARLAAGDYGQ